MQRLFIIVFTFGLPFGIIAQTLNGKVYDTKAPVKNIKVFNETQNRITLTNEKGLFSIAAKPNDTISFQSLFYQPKAIVLKPYHFNDTAVFEVVKIVSALDEVEVMAESEQPIFEEETYNIELQNLIEEDIKNNPQLYKPPGAAYGVDFVYLIGQVAKLFKRKKYKAPEYKPITYVQMDSLFEKSSFFNERLLAENLKIPKGKTKLFLDFCAAKQMSSELFKKEKKIELLEELVLNSQLFLILLEEYGKEKLKH